MVLLGEVEILVGTSKLQVCFSVLGQKVKGVEVCSLAGSIANVVWNVALSRNSGAFPVPGLGKACS